MLLQAQFPEAFPSTQEDLCRDFKRLCDMLYLKIVLMVKR